MVGEYFKNLKIFLERYERHISSVALVVGFVIDNLTLKRIDLLFENLVLGGYLVVAGTGIFLINLYEGGVVKGRFADYARPFLPIVVQFAFGGLFSGFVVFYSRSSSLVSSWPFMLLLVGVLIGNEMLKKYYLYLVFQISIFFLAVYSFFIFYVPLLVGKMGALVFLLSGVVSVACIALFMLLLSFLVPLRTKGGLRTTTLAVGIIAAIVNVFYFTNVLPPIPLSLKDGGVYHNIVRTNFSYSVYGEETLWLERFFLYDTIHTQPRKSVYVFSSVFAPTNLETDIVHHWQYRNPSTGRWQSVNKIRFAIEGGRDQGYRGYSVKSAVEEGYWRVNVETPRGQRIGRITFKVVYTDKLPMVRVENK